MSQIRNTVLCLLTGLLWLATGRTAHADSAPFWPFDPAPLSVLRASPHKVFAHYFTPFPLSLDNRPAEADVYATGYLAPDGEKGKHLAYGGYLRERPLPQAPSDNSTYELANLREEVRRAAALGLDGFSCDLLNYEGPHWRRVQLLMTAASEVDPGFKILLMPDMSAAFHSQPDQLAAAVTTLAQSPAAYRLPDGRLVVAPFNAQDETADWWKNWLARMKAGGVDIAFFPLFQDWKRYAGDFAPISYGYSDWGRRSVPGNQEWDQAAKTAHAAGVLWMAPVSPQDMRPKSGVYWEASNSENFRLMWRNAIQGGADWAQVITWNDYSEATEISPSTGTQYAFYDLTAYYVNWFKTGRAPVIKRDALFYFHRTQPSGAPPDPARQTQLMVLRPGDTPSDQIELLAFLTAPGSLEIQIGTKVYRELAPSGLTSFKVPLAPGLPVFRLVRHGRTVASVTSAFPISASVPIQDLLYRGGSSLRPPVTGIAPAH